jgi:lysophospholipase L1-like esterase
LLAAFAALACTLTLFAGARLASAQVSPFDPAAVPGLLFRLTPDRTAPTLVGGALQALGPWTAANPAARPGWVAVATGGQPAVVLSASSLLATPGGASGDPETLISVLAEVPAGQVSSIAGLAGLGVATLDQSNYTGALRAIGGSGGYLASWGPGDPGSNNVATSNFVFDGALHLFEVYHQSDVAFDTFMIDGQPVLTTGGRVDPETLTPGAVIGGYGAPTALNAHVYQAWALDITGLNLVGSGTTRWQMGTYVAHEFPAALLPTQVSCIGDSETAGSNLPSNEWATLSYPARLPYWLGTYGKVVMASGVNPNAGANFGAPGYRADQIAGWAPGAVDPYWTPLARRRLVVAYVGTNDTLQVNTQYGGSASQCAASVAASLQTLLAAEWSTGALGGPPIVLTLQNTANALANPAIEAARQAVNATIRALAGVSVVPGAPGILIADLDAMLVAANITPSNTTYYWPDGLHFTPTGYDLIAQLIAGILFPYVQ